MTEKDKGLEYPDDTPVEVPVRFRQSPGEIDRIKRLIREVAEEVANAGGESFEESMDFEVSDESDLPIPTSGAEYRYMQEEELLTSAREADRVVRERSAHTQWRNNRGKRGDRREAGNGGADGDANSRDENGGRESKREGESERSSGGAKGVRKGSGAV